jgi:hypothetical protein
VEKDRGGNQRDLQITGVQRRISIDLGGLPMACHLCRGNASEQKSFSSRDLKDIEKREEVRIVRGVAVSMELVQSAGTGEQNAVSSAIEALTIALNY